MDTVLLYKSHAQIEDLAVGECTMHRASNAGAARWWLLWFYAPRDTDGQPEVFCVPVQIGSYTESGPGGKTWGLSCPIATAHQPLPGTKNWAVSPSINVLNTRAAVAGEHSDPSLWHHTPELLNVPDDEPWATGAAP